VLAAPLTIVLVVLGRYIPNLEFITVLLGDEPPLSEQQEFYHRLLSGDAYAAIDQIEEAEEHTPPETVLDNLVFPALRLAVTDRRRGRLDTETVKELEETIDEVASQALPAKCNDDIRVLIIPVRGVFDTLAARFSVGAINTHAPNTAKAIVVGSGLTALSSIDPGESRQPDKLVFITVVGIAEKTLAFLAKRVLNILPKCQILFLDLTKPAGSIADASRPECNLQAFNRLSDLMASIKPASEPAGETTPADVTGLAADYKPAV
jgi:hypothetical protein